MKCDVCSKEKLFLHLVGKNSVCTECIAKHTVFKEVKHSSEARLRKALRAFDIKSFEELKNIKAFQLENLERMPIKRKKTVKYKKVNIVDDDYFTLI
jgi:hypothetical protein